jgi:hypothetical protein
MGMYKWQDMLEKYKYHGSASFTGGVSDERIKLVEQELRVNLPESYKCFLREYGYGSVFGVLIEGCCLSNINSVVDLTKESREMGMPDDFVVVMHCDEYQECLQTSKMIGDECPVKIGLRHETRKETHECFAGQSQEYHVSVCVF